MCKQQLLQPYKLFYNRTFVECSDLTPKSCRLIIKENRRNSCNEISLNSSTKMQFTLTRYLFSTYESTCLYEISATNLSSGFPRLC